MAPGTWIISNQDSAWIAAAVVLLALVLVAWSALRSPLRGWRRWVAAHCKLAAIALLAVLLLEPQSVSQVPRKGANDVAVLGDNGSGLGVLNPATKEPLGKEARDAWSPQAPWLKTLTETFRVQRYRFDSRLQEAGDATALPFDSPRSALVSSLDSLLHRYEQRPLAGVVVFTDGNATDAVALGDLMKRKATAPLYLVATGLEQPLPDLAVTSVNVTQSPFEDSPVEINARVSLAGLDQRDLTLVVRDEAGKVVLTEKAKAGDAAVSHVFHARFKPVAKGVSFYTAEVRLTSETAGKEAAASKEVTLENNRRLFAVDRKTGPYRVLYISGRPNWEYKFLRRALEADDEMKLVAIIRIAKREPKFQWRGRSGEDSNPLFRGFRPDAPEEAQRYDQPVLRRLGIADEKELAAGFPATAEDLFGAYRCVIIDDLEAEFFSRAQMDLLERYVSVRGGSLLMLGGQESFQQGGYANTPVARLLPVYLDRPAESAPVEDARFALTREGWLEPWMRLRKDEPEEHSRLGGMTPFYSVNAIRTIKPGASVLATMGGASGTPMPAWVTQRYGAGRVTAVTVGDLWRWAMKDSDSHQDFDKAWRQLMRHLVVDVPDRTELQTMTGQPGAQDRVQLRTLVRDPAFIEQDEASVSYTVRAPEAPPLEVPGEQSLAQAGAFEAAVPQEKGGAYRVQATVKDAEGKTIGEPVTGWATNPLVDELQSLTVNRPLLDQLAMWSGGKVLNYAALPGLAKTLSQQGAPLLETRLEPLWHSPWWWVLIVALLGVEWSLRRRAA